MAERPPADQHVKLKRGPACMLHGLHCIVATANLHMIDVYNKTQATERQLSMVCGRQRRRNKHNLDQNTGQQKEPDVASVLT